MASIAIEQGQFAFSTDALPARDRLAAFCDGFARRYVGLDIVKHEIVPFRAALAIRRGSAVNIARIDTSPVTFLRTPNLVRDYDDSLSVVLCRQGSYRMSQAGREHQLEPGEGAVLDHAHPAVARALVDASRWALKIPRARLAGLVPEIDRLAGCKLDSGAPALRLLRQYLEVAQAVDLVGGERLAQLLDGHVLDLVAYALGADGEAREIVEQGGVRQARLGAILNEIESRFCDARLTATVVATRLGVTPRYVHRLLEETGKTFSECVLEKRLVRTMHLLRDPRHCREKIVDIAFEAGFADLSHFNRSFRRSFGDTPSGVRAASRRENVR